MRDDLDVVIVAVLAAVGLQMFGLILINEVEDIPEDRAGGIETPVVTLGLWPVSIMALLMFALPAVVTIGGFAILIENPGARLAFVVAATLGQLLVIRDLAALTVVARQPAVDGAMGEPMPSEITAHRKTQLNPLRDFGADHCNRQRPGAELGH